ncbi:hypothetical protein GGU10DRAFT_336364 [Lentinula aff. detonsa]|uniref:DUF6533 domain-containing protein n=1 Tax=Lentinula aff. detonsa TaxID=2804958 RepID=A0AA38L254_9AGAR|nr:hypothetical protein GGU10DRAFT_336364 [Lentinula aff. detonsa]
MASPNDILPLFQAISSNQAAISSNTLTIEYIPPAAALTVLLYDCLLTFDIEVKYIWKSQWTIPKLLYLFAKYYGLAHLWYRLTGFYPDMLADLIQIGSCVLINVNLTGGGTPCIRLYALYRSSKLVLVLITSLIIAIFQYHSSLAHLGEFVAEFWGIYKSVMIQNSAPVVDFDAVEFIIPDIKRLLPGCQFQEITSINFNFTLESYIPNLFVSGDSSFASMKWFRSQDYNNSRITSSGNMLQVFIKDGTIFFFLIFSTVLMAMIIVVVQPILVAVSIPWIVGVYSFSGTKLILNLREGTDAGVESFSSTAIVGTLHRFQVHIPEVLSSTE